MVTTFIFQNSVSPFPFQAAKIISDFSVFISTFVIASAKTIREITRAESIPIGSLGYYSPRQFQKFGERDSAPVPLVPRNRRNCQRNISASDATRLIRKVRRNNRNYGAHFSRSGRNNDEETTESRNGVSYD